MRPQLWIGVVLLSACSMNDPDSDPGESESALLTYPSNPSTYQAYRNDVVTGISYQGGPLLTGVQNIHLVFYAGVHQDRIDALSTFVESLPRSTLLDVLRTYADGHGARLSDILIEPPVSVPFRLLPLMTNGGNLEFQQVARVAEDAAKDPRALYVIIAGPDVKLPKSKKGDCAWHSSTFDLKNRRLPYAVIIDGAPGCTRAGASGDQKLDEMIDMAWHEIAEAITDPYPDRAYHDNYKGTSVEIGDLCEGPRSHDYGTLMVPGFAQHDEDYPLGGGRFANIALGDGNQYSLQPIWQHVDGGGCVWRPVFYRPSVSLSPLAPASNFGEKFTLGTLLTDEYGDFRNYEVAADGSALMVGAPPPLPDGQALYGTGDFNGDALSDVLLRDLHTGRITIWTMFHGHVQDVITLAKDDQIPKYVAIKAVGDFDGDGRADILFQDMRKSTGYVWMNKNKKLDEITMADLTELSTSPPADEDWDTVGTGDFDGNGYAQVMWETISANFGDASFEYWDIGPTGLVTQHHVIGAHFRHREVLGVADVNGDGKAEIVAGQDPSPVIACPIDGPCQLPPRSLVSVDARTGVATTIAPAEPKAPWQYAGTTICASDLDGADSLGRQPCMFWRNRQTGEVSRWLLDGTSGALVQAGVHPIKLTANEQVVAP
jgi:hypothetical protein